MAAPFNASIERSKAFHAFAERIGPKKHGPEFHDSLIQTMRIPDGKICRDEQVWAWTRWRTWCNSSETAMSSWHSSGWELDQVDCAMDLHWFQAGKTAEWIEARTREERKAARGLPEVKKRRSSISRAFAKVEARGQVDLSRGRIYAVVSPTFGPQVVEKLDLLSDTREQDSQQLSQDPAFVDFLTLSGAGDLIGQVKEARDAYLKARKLLRGWERSYRAPGSPGGPILIEEKVVKDNSGGGAPVHSVVEEPPPLSSLSPEQKTAALTQHYLALMKRGESVPWPDDRMILDLHAIRMKAGKSLEDLERWLEQKLSQGRKPSNPFGWVRKVLAEEWG